MIEFFTILFIDYEAPSYGMAPMASVVYATEAHCQQALDDGLADPLYDHLMSLYGDDIMMFCYVTDTASSIIRPRSRPNGRKRQPKRTLDMDESARNLAQAAGE